MNEVRVQWLTQDQSLWESDWLRYIFSDVAPCIDVEFDPKAIKTDKNTVLICNHGVNYRWVLERLRQSGKQYVIMLLSDENLRDPCEWIHDPSCKGLIRNYINPYLMGHPKVQVIGLGYKKDFTRCLDSTLDRSLLWSFAGTLHGTRKDVVELFKDLGPNEIHACSGFGAADGLGTEDYVKMLQKSKYALIPEGQDSLDSFRLYEALEAGCVPITVNNSKQFIVRPSYWHGIFDRNTKLSFITGDTWDECRKKLEQETPETLRARQIECEALWETYKNLWKAEIVRICGKIQSPTLASE